MLKEYFTVGHSPDLKHFSVRIHDLDACADRKVQDHIYSALHKYLRSLKNKQGKQNGNS
jgi:hypothetical protein